MVGVSASVVFPCTIKSRSRCLLAPAHPGSPRKRAVKRLCVCVRACVRNVHFVCHMVAWLKNVDRNLMHKLPFPSFAVALLLFLSFISSLVKLFRCSFLFLPPHMWTGSCDLHQWSVQQSWILYIFTARRSYASAVLGVVTLSVCPSVCHTRALWLIQRTYQQYFYTTWKGNPSSFLPSNSGWWATSPST